MKYLWGRCREWRDGSDYRIRRRSQAPQTKEEGVKDMKYILLMSGTKAGVEAYHAWPKQNIESHMAVLQRINKDLTDSGELVATQGLAEPREAKVVRGEKDSVPITDGIFPESKEFLLGYWIVDVPNAKR